jgi:hypothetical protein
MRGRSVGLIAVLACLVASGPAASAPGRGAWSPRGAHAGIAIPFGGRSLAWLPFLGGDRGTPSTAATADGVELARSERFDLVGFDVHDHGLGVYLDVDGRVAFDKAEVVFADGDLQAIDLKGVERGRGLYELASFGAERPVLGVRMHARALSPHARIALRLGR